MTDVAVDMTIPMIDISGYLAGADATSTIEAVRDACERVGFFLVTGHGIDQALFGGVVDSMMGLAALPESELAALASPTGHPFRGVIVKRNESGDVTSLRMQANRFENPRDAVAHGVPVAFADYFHPNVWPHQIPEFRAAWRSCMMATREVGRHIMALFALALDLPSDYFHSALELDVTALSANWYPSQRTLSTGDAPAVILPAHEDSGVLTLLYQGGDYTGLQLHTAAGMWVDVPVVAGSLVINIGDLMTRWTNGRWQSTTHRVIASAEPGRSRVSIPTFYLPAVDTVVAPLPHCVGADGPQYAATTPYEYEAEFFRKPEEVEELGEHPGRLLLQQRTM